MAKIVDPILDYFFQIPLADGNILQFLSHHGFRVSKIQNADGSTKSLIFYHVSYPSKSVQFDDDGMGVENFLFSFQENLFFILDETELTFLIKTPLEEQGIAISKGDYDMNFEVRKVKYTGQQSNSLDDSIEDNTVLHLTKASNKYVLPHVLIQKIFTSFITNKKLLKLEEIIQEYRNDTAPKTDDAYKA